MYITEFSTVQYTVRYGLDGSGVEFLLGARFFVPVHTGPAAHVASCTMDPGVKRPGRDVYHPPLSSAEVKERVELYLSSPSRPSWPVVV